MFQPPLVIAHRSCPRHGTENSLDGIRLAGRLGVDGVEVDVQRTLDGVLMLHHDHTLWRVLRLPLPLWIVPSRVIRWIGRGRLPLFREALEVLPDGLFVAVDIKHPRAARDVLSTLRVLELESRAMLWSKSARTCAVIVREAPSVRTAYLNDARRESRVTRMLSDARAARASAVSAHWDTVTPGFIERAHAAGLAVYAMARSAESQAEKLATGLDGVVTDWPEEALQARNQMRTASIQ